MDPVLFDRPGRHRRVTDTVTGDLFASGPQLGRTFDAAVDKQRLLSKLERVIVLLSDRQWHSLDEVRAVGGSSGDRRLRQLRAMGFVIDPRRAPHAPENSGAWEYCLRIVPAHQVAYVERLIKHPSPTNGA